MVLILVRKVPTSLKGELSRWLMEPIPGVFLGHVSALVRDGLWKRCQEKVGKGGAILVHPWRNEQGFLLATCGELPREIIDWEGLYLARKHPKEQPPE